VRTGGYTPLSVRSCVLAACVVLRSGAARSAEGEVRWRVGEEVKFGGGKVIRDVQLVPLAGKRATVFAAR